jgi:lysophospholipase L1-like esterase
VLTGTFGLSLARPAQGYWLPPHFGRNHPLVIAAVGDSITEGVLGDSGGGIAPVTYPERLEDLVRPVFGSARVLNRGVGGETTSNGLTRIEAVMDQDRPTHVLIMEGTNDATFGVPADTVVANLRAMVQIVKSRNAVPILGLIVPNFRDAPEAHAIIAQVNAQLPGVALAEDIRLVDTSSAMNNPALFGPDDILHPNQQGYFALGDAWQPATFDALLAAQGILRGVTVAGGQLAGPTGGWQIVTGYGPTRHATTVRTFRPDGTTFGPDFVPFDPGDYWGGARVAACDLTGDGRAEIVVAKGVGTKPRVKVFPLDAAGVALAPIVDFVAFGGRRTEGAFVACGDVNGDGVPDIVVGTGEGVTSRVRAFRYAPGEPGGAAAIAVDFQPFPTLATGGVYVAVADLDGDGQAEIIVARGAGGKPEVRTYRFAPGVPGGVEAYAPAFLAFGSGFAGGVRVAAGDLDGDGRSEIVVGAGPGDAPRVRVYKQEAGVAPVEVGDFLAYARTFTGGVWVGVTDTDVLVGDGFGGTRRMRGFTPTGIPTFDIFAAH